MLYVLIIISLIALVLIILVGYDAISALYENLSHYHIGRWENKQQWKNAVLKVCKKWSVKTPKLKLRDDCRYLLIDRLKGKYSKPMVQSWQTAGCILGMKAFQENCFDSDFQKIKKQFLDKDGGWSVSVKKVDFAMLAYVLLKCEKDKQSIHKAMEQMIDCIEYNLCDDGMISYSAGKNARRRYVDTLGFVCPFLGLYGKIYNKTEYIDLAINQIKLFREKGFYKNFPVHCFQSVSEIPLGIYGWGRGMGWYSLGLTDLYLELDDNLNKKVLAAYMKEAAENWKRFERKDDGFSTIVQDQEHYDSSATVMLGYFYAICGKEFDMQEYTDIANRCLLKIIKHTKINGVIDGCLGDTKDIGVFSQRYGSMPFVQGMAIKLFAVLY
ncbi:MAG: glycoside hydrolase family 88 protein [Ruminococcus sp.]|nr:glycoside hydrolase family 88 protein [Ruminococcus sp.]